LLHELDWRRELRDFKCSLRNIFFKKNARLTTSVFFLSDGYIRAVNELSRYLLSLTFKNNFGTFGEKKGG